MTKNAKNEAIAQADAYANNAGLPTYSQLVKELNRMVSQAIVFRDAGGVGRQQLNQQIEQAQAVIEKVAE